MVDETYTPIVREPDLQRTAAVARAVLAEFERLRPAVGHRPEVLTHLLAGPAIVADDEHGRRHGLVGQADGLHWSEVDQLAETAATAVDPDQHAGPGTWHRDCSDCEALLAIARIRARHRYRTVGPHAADRPGGAARSSGAGRLARPTPHRAQ